NQPIKVTITESNGVGSPASATSSATSNVAGVAPSLSSVKDLLSGITSSGEGVVSWRPPATSGGATVLSYEIQESLNHGVTWTSSPHTRIVGTRAFIFGLSTSRIYDFRVVAIGSLGTRSISAVGVTEALPRRAVDFPFGPFSAFKSSYTLRVGGRAQAVRLLTEIDVLRIHTLTVVGYAIYEPAKSMSHKHGLTLVQVTRLARGRAERAVHYLEILDSQLHLAKLSFRIVTNVHHGKKGLSNFDYFRRVSVRA
ncbi:MAG: fibronectin type III domain-containing protein, partial [Acidimicrobiaceae bacterium]|nr:fibronectin type III domain-containing protein [Acidimicrobiaceae bacterium]